jgi:two-component system, NarL family, response regulator LiaR
MPLTPSQSDRKRWRALGDLPMAPRRASSKGGGATEPDASDRKRWRLIIADDDSVVRSMLSLSLQGAFEIVGVAEDSECAVELARTVQPDVALVDVEMPKGGGLPAVRGILEVSPATAVVVLSGDESDVLVRELIQAGAITYQRKGVPTRVLGETLVESIRVHATELQAQAGERPGAPSRQAGSTSEA